MSKLSERHSVIMKPKSKSRLMKERKRRQQNAEAVKNRKRNVITGKFPYNDVKVAILDKLLTKREK